MKQTPLYNAYASYPGVKLIDFGGWELPVNFAGGILAEHHAVRNAAGLFDVSHMGECLVSGSGAKDFLDMACTNDIASLKEGHVMYTMMCNPQGTVVDDILVYCFSPTFYFLVLNAANTEKDIAWLKDSEVLAPYRGENVSVIDQSSYIAQIALQGPQAVSILSRAFPQAKEMGVFTFEPECYIGGVKCLVSRTGYTGEDGFELYCNSNDAVALWNELLKLGEPFGLVPCGLGARDTLRMEAKLPLYGHEISDTITPLEANLGVFVVLDGKNFIGHDVLQAQKDAGVPRTLRGIEMIDPGVPRQGYPVWIGDQQVGYITSGAKSPTLDIFCGYALLDRSTALKFGDEVEVEIHGKRKRAKIVRTPFYKRGVRNTELR